MKKLLFICGSLLRGRDGVGDYVRCLSAELMRTGLEVEIVATHDTGVTGVCSELQSCGGSAVSVHRIAKATSPLERMNALRRLLTDFQPDWISLQYVPYSYHHKGLPYSFIQQLGRLGHKGRWHVMFHELWVGTSRSRGVVRTITSKLQQRLVKQLVATLRPEIIHTHLPAYQLSLRQIDVGSSPLPLFANIPPDPDSIFRLRQASHPPRFRVVFFSQIAVTPAVITFLRELSAWLTAQKIILRIDLVGGNIKRAEPVARQLSAALGKAEIHTTGFLSTPEISDYFHAADLGVTPVPRHALGKSGTVAAFLSHGLPVAAPEVIKLGQGFFSGDLNDAIITHFTPEAFHDARSAIRRMDTSIISSRHIAEVFSYDLNIHPVRMVQAI